MAASRLFQIKSFFSYWLDAVDEHSLHSPFYFDFYTQVVKPPTNVNSVAEQLRKKLLADSRKIKIDDFGTGPDRTNREIADIAHKSLSSASFSAVYRRAIEKYKLRTVVELGTSLGINTIYLATAPDTTVVTFEGSEAIADLAAFTFEFAHVKNITIIKGNLDNTLSAGIQVFRKIDFVFMDANHTYEATVNYFNVLVPRLHDKSVVVIDDIHYSPGMNEAWKEIQRHPLVHGSADLFRCGFLFFDPSLTKQHVVLQF